MSPMMETATDWSSSDGSVRLLHGDCLERMAEIPADSIDAVVADPPYGLEFMGVGWDTLRKGAPRVNTDFDVLHSKEHPRKATEQAGIRHKKNVTAQRFHEAWATAALRVLKPGGHLVAFGGTRTHHRLWCALEDAGFEIRDTLMWLYGSGFPKSLDVSKAIDKAAGAEREVVAQRDVGPDFQGDKYHRDDGERMVAAITAPATDAARQWDGWGTALKPAWEPIVLARKPLLGTVAANVQAHGTGALNVDGCRVGTAKDVPASPRRNVHGGKAGGVYGEYQSPPTDTAGWNPRTGRWPANVVLDEEAAAMLDAQSGERVSGARNGPRERTSETGWGSGTIQLGGPSEASKGGASRFFYCAKASRAERGKNNSHPTVKPLALMRWLVRLVTPPGGLILDPFIGSGTTALAAVAEGFRCVGIDSEGAYLRMMATRATQIAMAGV